MSFIKIDNLSFSYRKDDKIINDLSLEVEEGSFTAIIGPNGTGKTTLINILCRQLDPDQGSVYIQGKDVKNYSFKKLAKLVSVVRQEMLPVYDFSVEEAVMMARMPYVSAFGMESEDDRKFARDALELTEVSQFRERNLRELSGGERQRVFIARAIAQDTPVMLLDEPTSFLDYKHQVEIFDLLKYMQKEKGKTIVSVTHDINLAGQYCDDILVFDRQGGHYTGKCEQVLTQQTIEKAFDVKTFCMQLQKEKFFLPLGKLAKDASVVEEKNK